MLVVMAVAGGLKFVSMKAGAGGAGGGQGGGPAAAQGGPGRGGPGGGPGGGRGGPGGRGGFGGPAMVTAAVVQPRVFRDNLEVLGVAKGRRSVTLTAATTQLIDKVRFSDGQSVRQGAILVELKATEQNAGIAQSQAKLNQSEREYQRWKTLSDKGFASKSAVDQYQAAWLSAKADLAAAQAREGDRMIRAPFSGVVGLSDVAPGALVNPGAPIVTLDDLSAIRVDFPVPEQYMAQIHDGQEIEASVEAYPGQKVRGRIQRIDTRVDERTRSITARAEFPNPDHRLKPGMLIRVAISRGQRQALSAPESAVAVQGDSAFVFVIHSQGPRNLVEQRPVVTGLRQDDFVEILDGVQPGDHIVADGLNKVQSGQPVRVVGGPGAGPGGGPGGPGMGMRGRGGPGAAPRGGMPGAGGPGAGRPDAGVPGGPPHGSPPGGPARGGRPPVAPA